MYMYVLAHPVVGSLMTWLLILHICTGEYMYFNYFQGRIVEPLCDFHKDEVRLLGKSLGLPDSIVHRHPFPGK